MTSGQSLSLPKAQGDQGLIPTSWLSHHPAGGMCVIPVVRTPCVCAWRVIDATPQMQTGPLGGSRTDDHFRGGRGPLGAGVGRLASPWRHHALGDPCFLLQSSCLCSSTAACGPMLLSPLTASSDRMLRSGKDRPVPAHMGVMGAPRSRAREPFLLRPEAHEASCRCSLLPLGWSCQLLSAGDLGGQTALPLRRAGSQVHVAHRLTAWTQSWLAQEQLAAQSTSLPDEKWAGRGAQYAGTCCWG